ncbi:MAG: glycerophosphodiester phosphodiesterase [Rubrivivax sp.]|nr:glycerophosphodiester phosphodiesterase [Rubrivivax sp.]
MNHSGKRIHRLLLAAALVAAVPTMARADDDRGKGPVDVELGDRPFYLIDGMDDGPLKSRLMSCRKGPFKRTDFSIGHRGAALQFPEHTKESYEAGARQGAGIVECDVTFTRDGQLVCRHAENDLHTTTNILVTPLASTCIKPFAPAMIDANGNVVTPASAECRASALTLAEFKSLTGKMDAFNRAARNAAEYLGGTASWRTDLYTGRGTLMSFRDSIELNQRLGVKHTPELKGGDPATIAQVFGSQENYALAFAAELRNARVKPRDVWPQSFNVEDVFTWIDKTEYGRQAVYLLDYDANTDDIVIQPPYDQMPRADYFRMLKQRGVRIIAPPMPALLAVDAAGRIVPSPLAKDLKDWGFDIITWTIERSDLRRGASRAGYYYDFDPQGVAVKKDSDLYPVLDVLAREVKVLGIFSDWPATVTYYANCMRLK